MERRGTKGSDVVCGFVVMAKSNFTRIHAGSYSPNRHDTHKDMLTQRIIHERSHKAHKSATIPRNPHAQTRTKAQDTESAASLYFTETGTRGATIRIQLPWQQVVCSTLVDVGIESV